jgi:hypothetical protein
MTPNTDSTETTIQRGTLHLSGVDPEQPLQRSFILMMAALGLLWIGLGIFSDTQYTRYGQLGFGLFLLLSLAYIMWFYKPKYLRFDQSGLTGLIKGGETILLNWEAIETIEISVNKLVIHPQSGVEIPISIGQIPYQQHKDLLPQLEQVAERNGVKIKKSN